MKDFIANTIVLGILLFSIIGILHILNTILGGVLIDGILSKMKNNSGKFSGTKILMFAGFIILLFLIWIWLTKSKNTSRASLTRSKDTD